MVSSHPTGREVRRLRARGEVLSDDVPAGAAPGRRGGGGGGGGEEDRRGAGGRDQGQGGEGGGTPPVGGVGDTWLGFSFLFLHGGVCKIKIKNAIAR